MSGPLPMVVRANIYDGRRIADGRDFLCCAFSWCRARSLMCASPDRPVGPSPVHLASPRCHTCKWCTASGSPFVGNLSLFAFCIVYRYTTHHDKDVQAQG